MLVSKDQKNNAVIFGGSWSDSYFSGSRASVWAFTPSFLFSFVSARAVCYHLNLNVLSVYLEDLDACE